MCLYVADALSSYASYKNPVTHSARFSRRCCCCCCSRLSLTDRTIYYRNFSTIIKSSMNPPHHCKQIQFHQAPACMRVISQHICTCTQATNTYVCYSIHMPNGCDCYKCSWASARAHALMHSPVHRGKSAVCCTAVWLMSPSTDATTTTTTTMSGRVRDDGSVYVECAAVAVVGDCVFSAHGWLQTLSESVFGCTMSDYLITTITQRVGPFK